MNLLQKKIAVIGVSNNPAKYGSRIFHDLLHEGYSVEGVNVNGGEVAGKQLFKDLRDIPRKPDLVITVVPPEVTEHIVDECRELGIREIWMQPGSESDEAVGKARRYNMMVTYNACVMVSNGVW